MTCDGQVKESDIVKFEAGSFDKACISADVGHHQLSRKLQVRVPPPRTWTGSPIAGTETGNKCTETGNTGRGRA